MKPTTTAHEEVDEILRRTGCDDLDQLIDLCVQIGHECENFGAEMPATTFTGFAYYLIELRDRERGEDLGGGITITKTTC